MNDKTNPPNNEQQQQQQPAQPSNFVINVDKLARTWTWKDVLVEVGKIGVVVAASAAGTMLGMKLASGDSTSSNNQVTM